MTDMTERERIAKTANPDAFWRGYDRNQPTLSQRISLMEADRLIAAGFTFVPERE